MQKGWVKLHRKIQDHWIYQEKRQFSRYEAWLDLIMMANHKDNKTLVDGELITIEKGSFITSKRELGRRWDWSNSKVDKFLELLNSDEMIVYKSDTKKTVVTIAKYEVYHDSEKEKRNENETEANQKLIENETETNKQECKELKALEELKELSTTTATTAAPKIENGFGNLIRTFEENLCMLSPIQIESLGHWFDDFNQNSEVFTTAIKIAADRNRKNFGFVEYLLKEWSHHKLTTVEQIESHERNKFNQQKQNRWSGKPTRVERVPEWFNKDKQPEVEQQEIPDKELEEERRELAKKLEIMRRENA